MEKGEERAKSHSDCAHRRYYMQEHGPHQTSASIDISPAMKGLD